MALGTPTVDADFTEFVDRNTGGSNRNLTCAHDMTPNKTTHDWPTLTELFVNAGLLVEIAAASDAVTWVPRAVIF